MVKVIVEGPNKKSSVGTRMNYVFSRVPAQPDHRITWPSLAQNKCWPGPAQNLWPGPLPDPARPGSQKAGPFITDFNPIRGRVFEGHIA